MPNAPKVVGFVLIVFLIAFSFPILMDSPNQPHMETFELQEEESTVLNDRIEIYLDTIKPNDGNNVTVTALDTETLAEGTRTIEEGNSATFSLSDGDVTVTVLTVSTSAAELTVEYPRLYGWHDAAKTIVGNLHLILAGLAVVVIVGFAGVIRQ